MIELENILNKIFEVSISSSGSDDFKEIIDYLNELVTFAENVSDESLRQWILEYCNFWANPLKLYNDIDSFRDETGELIAGLNNQNSIDLEFEN